MSNWPKVAENVVNRSLRIHKDDVVSVTASRPMLDLADEIAIKCRLAGAETTTLFWSEPLWIWSIEKLPIDWLRSPNRIDPALYDVVTATINIRGPGDPTPMTRIPAERWAANAEGADPSKRKYNERKPRSALLNIPLVTPQRAAVYGFPFEPWKENVEDALATDFSQIQTLGKKLVGHLDGSGAKVRVTAKNGTDISFRLAGRKCRNDDGVLDEEDLAAGTFETNLPAGSIIVPPDEQSANGKVVFDLPVPFLGKLVEGINWTFANGSVEEFKASKNSELILDLWRKSTGDKSRMGWFGLGYNLAAKTGFLNDEIASGTVTLGIGDNTSLGGKNESTFGFQGTLTKSTVTIDDQTIVSNGVLAG